MPDTSRLVKMRVRNLGCIGPDGCEVALDDVLCLVGGNNTGKSTILRAYELAVGTASFDPSSDPCKRAAGGSATVEIWVHIPKGMGNIADKWKVEEEGLSLVRSKWQWSAETSWKKERTTWDPEANDYSGEDKASGLDTVFSSRLPTPFRIGSLDHPDQEHAKLLTLVLQPIAEKIQKHLVDENSELWKAIDLLRKLTQAPVDEEKASLDVLKKDLNRSHNAIFPELQLDFDIGIGQLNIEPLQMLIKNSKLKFLDWLDEVSWTQQGTGSQRALFWTILQVRSRLKTLTDLAIQNRKAIFDAQKEIKKLQADAEKAKKEETKQAKYAQIVDIEKKIANLVASNPEDQLAQDAKELALPGYMLLVDEPETGLHPNAIRAASRYLYGLADERSWQVMLATHSPLFIDPLHDHTTIVRLARSSANPSPTTYRSDSAKFSDSEKDNLKILNRFDQGLAEMFFGQLPLVVEGDTEYAAFEALINKYQEQFPVSRKPVIVRARGKHIIVLVMRILGQFKVPFALLHDADTPFRKDGKKNVAWAANKEIYEHVQAIRSMGVRVVHRISFPTFEHTHVSPAVNESGGLMTASSKDKPWRIIAAMNADPKVEASILGTLTELTSTEAPECQYGNDFMDKLGNGVKQWATQHCPKDKRFGLG